MANSTKSHRASGAEGMEGSMLRLLCVMAGLLLGVPATASAQTPTPEAMSAARNLVSTMKLADQYRALLPSILLRLRPVVTQDRPEIERDYDAMTTMIADAYTPFYNEMVEDAASAYATSFSVDEIRQIDAFYRLPVGQKLLEKSPGIAQQAAQVGQEVSQKAAEALRLRLTDALRQKGHKL
jgi:hypothetical protein